MCIQRTFRHRVRAPRFAGGKVLTSYLQVSSKAWPHGRLTSPGWKTNVRCDDLRVKQGYCEEVVRILGWNGGVLLSNVLAGGIRNSQLRAGKRYLVEQGLPFLPRHHPQL